MSDCHVNRDLMLEALYGEISPRERAVFEAHLTSCPGCAADFKALKATVGIFDPKNRPDPGPEFWDGYWNRLERKLDLEGSSGSDKMLSRIEGRRIALRFFPKWAVQGLAAAALVTIGVFLGRTVLGPPARTVRHVREAGFPAAEILPASSSSAIRTRNYFERSKLVILGFVNFDPGTEEAYGLDLPRQKRISRELVQEAALLKNELSSPAQKRLHELVSDLETILVQIANLKSENDIPAVDVAIKEGVKSKGLLLKINLTEMEGLQ